MGLLGADEQAEATESAANISAASSAAATKLQRDIYEQTRKDQEPWRLAGVNALGQLSTGTAPGGELLRPFAMTDYQADPGYAFRLKEGMRGLEQSAAARGSLLSGNTLKGITGYGQEMASQEYQNAYNRYQTGQANQFNRLASMSGLGQTATAALGQAGSAYGTNVGNITMQGGANQANAALMGGQTRASMYQGLGTALGSGIQNVSQGWGDLNSPYGQFNAWLQG